MRAPHRLATLGVATALAGATLLSTAGVASAATATTAPNEPTRCATGSLPVQVVGADGVKAQDALGLYLWHGKTGYALRVTHPGHQKVVFTGTVTVSSKLTSVHRVKLEKQDTVKVGLQRHTLAFRFVDYGYLDGVNFAASCSATVVVSLHIDKVAATPAQVFLGAAKTHPTSVPFTIERTKLVKA
jgi:hypothetical protein